ncbi:MAG: DUF1573 domain-containing protein [Bacteroidales bacterium]|nr:DUF1573 domain-containing protein [Bacteroidales bacterium]MCF6342455.1 DUF1573 domain-containing protein [Bacteroidales bacterium]
MRYLKGHILILLLMASLIVLGQKTVPDSSLIRAYPFRIGNIGFSVDSLETVIGKVVRGDIYKQQIELFNFGKKPIELKGGKSSRFIEIRYMPGLIQPGQSATAFIDFDVLTDLPTGPIEVEVVVETDDKQNAFKFLYLLADIIEDTTRFETRLIIDTVPRMVFNDYNYNFGHLIRGKKVTHTFYFTNMGSEDLFVGKISSSNGCRVISSPEDIIPPGGSGRLVVQVKTVGNIGVQHRTVSIQSNDPVNPVIILGLHGTVRQPPPAKQNQGFCYE